MKLFVNAENGSSGSAIDVIEAHLNQLNIPVEFIKIHHKPEALFQTVSQPLY
ncbi:MAG: hypothetical protein HRT54_06505 [Colwellia sp.]|nr:hypothetical protein [Colwellia sp.]